MEAMEELTEEARSIYDLLKEDMTVTLDKSLKEQRNDLVLAVRKMLDETSSSLEEITTKQIDAIREDLNGEIAPVRSELEKVKEFNKEPRSGSLGTPRRLFTARATSSAELGHDKENRRRAQSLYVPPPVRGAVNPRSTPVRPLVSRDLNRPSVSTPVRPLVSRGLILTVLIRDSGRTDARINSSCGVWRRICGYPWPLLILNEQELVAWSLRQKSTKH